jgi:predicted  nucleic acid-binding Zn-ribbon protein
MNEKLKEYLVKSSPMIVIIILLITVSILWNMYSNSQAKVDTISKQINMVEEIQKTEARLKEIQAREIQYKELEQKQAALMKSITALDIKRKELEKRKKEVIENEIKNFTQTDIKNALTDIGISGTIVE